MRHSRSLVALALLAVLGCESEGLGPAIDTSLSIVVEQEAELALAADAGVVRIVGPSTRTVNIQPGETRTITGLTPGTYVVTLEALLGGRLEAFGATTVAVVAGQNRQANLTLRSFVPSFLNVPDEVGRGSPFTVQFGSVTGATSYRVEWDDDQGFQSPMSTQVTGTTAQITIDAAGPHHVRVSAQSEFGTQGVPTASQQVDVIEALSVTTTELPDGTVGTPYSQTLQAVGGDGTYQWSLAAGTLPPGLALSTAGVLSGTPTTAGEYTFTVEVASAGLTAERQLTLVVQPGAPSITTEALPDATVDQPYSQTLEATGGDGSYQWSITSGALPPGLALSTAGVVSGTPTTAGEYTFTVAVASAGLTAERQLTLVVRAATLTITTEALADARVDQPYSQTLEATGGDGSYQWSIVSGTLPPGLALSTAGVISGTPTTAGEYTFTVQVTSSGLTADRQFTIRVLAVPLAYVYARNAQLASYTPDPGDFANLAGGSIQITRTGTGAYTIDVEDLHTAGTSFSAFVNALSPAPNSDLTAGGAVCRLRGLAGGGPATPIRVFVACEDPSTGDARDSQYRLLVVGDEALGQPGMAGPQAGFSLHSEVGATTGYTPLGDRAWNSLGNPQRVTPLSSGLIRHETGLDVSNPFTVAVGTLDGAAGTGGDICTLQNGAATFVDVQCTARLGGITDRPHFVLQLEEGRSAAPWAYAFVRPSAPEGEELVDALTAASSGGVTASTQGVGRWTLTFSGLLLEGTPAIMVTPVLGTGDPWASCSHFRTGNAPLTVDVACFDTSGAFVDAAFTILALQ